MIRRRPTHSEQYRAHLRSPEWSAIRKAALERSGYRCAFCGQTRDELRKKDRHLEVHHNNYVNLGKERPEDLTVLCAGRGGCHAAADRQRRAANGRRVLRRPRRSPVRWLPRRLRRVLVTIATMFALVISAPLLLPDSGNGILVGDSCSRNGGNAKRIYLSKAKYPNVIDHIKESWREGYPHVLRIHRKGAKQRRSKLLYRWKKTHPQPVGDHLDLDERPAAVLRRKTYAASVRPMNEHENRSEGQLLGQSIKGLCEGVEVIYVFGP